jgi:hypothetical protein
MTNEEIIEKQKMLLEEAGATNTSNYLDKLRTNRPNRDVFEDLLFEGRTALMFLLHGFSVDMRDSPDLGIQLASNQLYAEVKHFRLKGQDRIDQTNMEMAQDEQVPFGDTFPLEDKAAWIQVTDVAKRKTKQYRENVPNILVIGSSSPHCIDDSIMSTVINILSEAVSNGESPALEKLNGILLISPEYNLSRKRRVYFFPTHQSRVPLNQEVLETLNSIRNG